MLEEYCKFANYLSLILAKFSYVLFLLLILNVIIEVISRYFFNNPTVWSIEIAQYLYGITFLLSGAFTLQQKGHVRVDILLMAFSQKVRRILGIICHFVSIFYLSVLLYIAFIKAYESLKYMEVMDTVWAPYTWPVMICLPIAVFVMILQAFAMIIQTWKKLYNDEVQHGI